jgi:hypothetical protein
MNSTGEAALMSDGRCAARAMVATTVEERLTTRRGRTAAPGR